MSFWLFLVRIFTVTKAIQYYEDHSFSYPDDTTLMAESEEELKSLLMKVKEESEKLA